MIRKLFFGKTNDTRIQLFRNIFTAASTYLINFYLLYLFIETIHLHLIPATALAGILSGINSYLLTKLWVFTHKEESTSSELKSFIIFIAVGAVGLGVLTFFTWFFATIFGIHYLISNALAETICFFFNFFTRKTLIYSKKVKVHKQLEEK